MIILDGYNGGEVEKLGALLKGFQGEALNGVKEWPTYIADRFELSRGQTIYLDGLYELLPFATFSVISAELIEKYEKLTSDWRDNTSWVEKRTQAFDNWLETELKKGHDLSEGDASAVVLAMGTLIHHSGYMIPVDIE